MHFLLLFLFFVLSDLALSSLRRYLVSNDTMSTVSKSNKCETFQQKITTPLSVSGWLFLYTYLSFIGFWYRWCGIYKMLFFEFQFHLLYFVLFSMSLHVTSFFWNWIFISFKDRQYNQYKAEERQKTTRKSNKTNHKQSRPQTNSLNWIYLYQED